MNYELGQVSQLGLTQNFSRKPCFKVGAIHELPLLSVVLPKF